jgi:hypothetical protein
MDCRVKPGNDEERKRVGVGGEAAANRQYPHH